jgi:flagellar biosynthesis anti-sigma factor FlgM
VEYKHPVCYNLGEGLKRLWENADSSNVKTGERVMKIELNNSLASLLPPENSVKKVSTSDTAATQSATGATQDRTTFHSDSLSVQSLTSQALNSPEIRQDKVDTLSQSVNSGTYPLDSKEIAGAIIDSNGK